MGKKPMAFLLLGLFLATEITENTEKAFDFQTAK